MWEIEKENCSSCIQLKISSWLQIDCEIHVSWKPHDNYKEKNLTVITQKIERKELKYILQDSKRGKKEQNKNTIKKMETKWQFKVLMYK